ncbi:MAG: hypothetical protein H0V30_04185 [Chitinophagaceae bacterium]|nr:hypothetical protein [Chitinophagaceae bacterium]
MATPFMHSGMYSGTFKVQSEISVTELIIDGKKLSASDYSATEWDKIIMPAELYCRHHLKDKIFYQEDIKRLLARFKLPSNETSFYTALSKDEFLILYKKLLSSLIGKKIHEIEIIQSKYQYLQIDHDARYILINSKDFLEQCN